ncbi:Wzz/FepE/Etk N-terminal domain-containing protein, partial [bacterium]|nr:Wzz/FepE/Etk N-terminal domain-containing protein [bacterium]
MAFVSPSIAPESLIIKDILSALLRGWKTILLVFLGTVLGVYAGLMYVTEQYEVEARVLVKLGRENAEVPITVEKGGVYTTGVQKEEIYSYIQLLSSRSLIKATVDTIGAQRFLAGPPPPQTILQTIKYYIKEALRWVKQQGINLLILLDLKKELSDEDKAIKLVQNSLSVERERDSNVIRLSMQFPDPYLAREFLEKLLDLYLKRHVDLRRDLDIGKVFEVETAGYREQLTRLQAKILDIKQKWNLSDVDVQRSGMITRLEKLKAEMNTRRAELARLKSEKQARIARLKKLPEKTLSQEIEEPNPARTRIKDRLLELRVQRVGTLNRYWNDSESVALLDKEIA